jgi:hypothetical protein
MDLVSVNALCRNVVHAFIMNFIDELAVMARVGYRRFGAGALIAMCPSFSHLVVSGPIKAESAIGVFYLPKSLLTAKSPLTGLFSGLDTDHKWRAHVQELLESNMQRHLKASDPTTGAVLYTFDLGYHAVCQLPYRMSVEELDTAIDEHFYGEQLSTNYRMLVIQPRGKNPRIFVTFK